MSLLPRFVQSEFAPMFRLLDDYSAHVANNSGRTSLSNNNNYTTSLRSFNPRFDVKETKEGYTLEGELPGVEQKDVSVEWMDHNTLQIKGRSEHRREESSRPSAAAVEAATSPEKAQTSSDAESESSYHKATVEDEAGGEEFSPTVADATPATTPAVSETSATGQQPERQTDASKWWISERSVGEFSRTFSFPNRVDQENVRASLKNGILSIVVPKASVPETRRIHVE